MKGNIFLYNDSVNILERRGGNLQNRVVCQAERVKIENAVFECHSGKRVEGVEADLGTLHATIVGEILPGISNTEEERYEEIIYDPSRKGAFYIKDTNERVFSADTVYIDTTGEYPIVVAENVETKNMGH